MGRYRFVDLAELKPVLCPCGESRRAFGDKTGDPVSVHLVHISRDSKAHYHKRLTEIYVVLQGEGHLELDGEKIPAKPLRAVVIEPGCRHRAVGDLLILNIVSPPFDPQDEWFD